MRNIDAAWHYINKCNEPEHPKHGEGITFGDMSDQCITKVGHLKQSSWHHIIDALNKEEFFERMRKNDPKAAVVPYNNVAAYANAT